LPHCIAANSKDKGKKSHKEKKSGKEKKGKDKKSRGSTRSSASGRSSSSSPASRSAKAPKKFSPKLLKEVDEGTRLEVSGKTHKNCCMPLSLARATLGPDAKQAEVHAWAAQWVEKLPENKQKACRVTANEANLGEGLYDDYVKFEIENEATQAKVIFVVDASGGKTRVWAAEGASMDDMHPIFLRHEGFHFTALMLQTSDIPEALADLPPIEGFSFVGPADLLAALLKAQKK
jgi:Mg-chelatase subunit ChlD